MDLIKLLNVNNYRVDTSDFEPLLNDNIVNEFENLFFDVFMKYGWHLSLREGLYCENHYKPNTKLPFPRADKEIINNIKNIIKEMKLKLKDYE